MPTDSQAIAMRWSIEITTGGVILALPTVGGWWLDDWLQSAPWCLIVGGFLGLILSFLHLLTITGALKSGPKKK